MIYKIYKTLRRKLNIEQHEPPAEQNLCAPEGFSRSYTTSYARRHNYCLTT